MTKFLRLVLAICIATTLHFNANAQSVSINTTGAVANPSAMLDVTSTSKGVLIPRMDKTQKNAIATPATGLLIYQTLPDSIGFHYYDGAQWVWLSGTSDSTAWKITGNSNITSANFLGTINDTALRFRVKDIPSGLLDSASANTTLGFRSNAGLTTGLNNTFMGFRAGVLNDTTSNNTFVGFYAGERNRNSNNVAIGAQAGRFYSFSNQSTTEMTAVGTEAGHGAFINPKSTAIGYRAFYSRQGGTIYGNTFGRNTAIGDSALAFAGYGYSNVAVGNEALSRVFDGYQNVAVGDSALGGALSTVGNVAIGYKTLSKQQGQGWNTAVGYYSQRDSSKSTYYNTSIGAYSMEFNRTGVYNTGLGLSAMRNADSTSYNTAVGADAMYNHKKNGSNLAAGAFAMRGDSAGYWNTAVGSEAMDRVGLDGTARGTGFSNVAVGFRALRAVRQGWENTAVGVGALESDSSGNYNTAVGRYSGFLNKRGSYNVSMGMESGVQNDSANATTFIGYLSGYYNKNHYNTGIGAYSLTYNNFTTGSSTTGAENTGLGYGAGYRINLGSQNTAIGFQSMNGGGPYISGNRNVAVGDSTLFSFSTGNDNVAMGYKALSNAQTGSQSVAVGSRALINFSGGYPNTAVGYSSMDSVTTGTANTAVGSYSLTANKAGINNVAVGNAAMYESTAGSDNTAVGNNAGRFIRAGQNVALGSSALPVDSTGSNNVAIGYQSALNADTASAVIAIGTLALAFNRSDSNVAIGYRAGRTLGGNISWAPTEATFLGNWAGDGAFVSSKNTAVGFRALTQRAPNGSATDYIGGGRNTAIGDSSMANTVGISNVSIGAMALNNGGVGVFNNIAIGDSAMGGAKLVNDNVAIGYHSLKNSNYPSTSNTGNTATGAYTGGKITSGYYNTVNGYYALENATTAAGVTAIGTSSFRTNVSGFDNVGVGINTGFHATSGANTYLGSYAGEGAAGFSTGGSNTATGYFALSDIRSGISNTAVGRQALTSDTSGSYNVAIGQHAMYYNLASDFNTAVGYNSLLQHKRTGFTYNTGLGSFALEQDSSGYENTGVGTSAFRLNKTGILNTGVGIDAGYFQKESYNTFIGGYSGFGERTPGNNYAADTGNYNAGLGVYSLYRIANGSNNVAMGYSAMYSDSSGNLNTAVGNGALYSNTGSHTNQAFGWNALYNYNSNSNGWNNAFGDLALQNLATGTQNVTMGSWAMINHTTGFFNTAIGNYVMGNGTGGSQNTALGASALWNTSADNNVGIGAGAGSTNTTGTNNTLLGSYSDVTTTGLTNATAIGYNARVAASNSLVLGQAATNVGIGETSPNARLHIVRNGSSGGTFHASSEVIIEDNTSSYITLSNPNANENGILSGNASTTIKAAVIFRADSTIQFRAGGNTTRMSVDNNGFIGIGTVAPNYQLELSTNSAGKPISSAWIISSDNRLKNIDGNYTKGLADILKLNTIRYHYAPGNARNLPTDEQAYGFSAQEVQKIFPEAVKTGKDGFLSLDLHPVFISYVNAIKEQQQQIEDLKKKNEQLEKDMQAIKAKLGINN